MYSDILITTSFSINMWDLLFKGQIFDFYNLCPTDINNSAYQITNMSDYDFFIYIIFGIWNLPIWLVRKITNINIWESTVAIMWMKIIILVFAVLTVIELRKICAELEFRFEDIKNTLLIFATSSILYMAVFVTSQYDIIYLFFMMKAFNWYIKNDLWKFTTYMAITLPIKPLSIFLFPALIMYKEKNIIKILLKVIIVFLPWVLLKIIFPMGEANNGNMSNILVMFDNKLIFRDVEIPLFIFSTVLLYLFCYIFVCPTDKKEADINSIKIAVMSYMLFFVICNTNPYWYILILPFQSLLMVGNNEYKFINVILETVTSICYIGMYVWTLPWCFGANLVRSTYLCNLFGPRYDETDNILDILHKISHLLYDMAESRAVAYLFMIFFAGNILFVYINYIKHKELYFKDKEIPKWLWAIRYLLGISVCMLPIISFLF